MKNFNLELDNRIGILEKVCNVLTRNRVNLIEIAYDNKLQLPVCKIRISTNLNACDVEKLKKQFQRIVEVRKIEIEELNQ